jgi:HK97 family phage portal protein
MTNDFFQFPAGQSVTGDQRKDFKEYLRKKAQGVANAHNPLILENGAEWKRVAITAKDAQLLELLQYTAVDVARIFGCPPHMIGEMDKTSAWGTGIEQLSLGFIRYTIMPHARRFAKELTRKLFPVVGARRSKYFVDFDVDALMEGDAAAQGAFFRIALGGNQLPGFMTMNEVRRRKNLPPVDGGDEVYVPTGAPADPEAAPATPSGGSKDESQAA